MKIPISKESLGALRGFAGNAAILGLWAWLFHPVYSYLGTLFTRQEFRTNQVAFLGAALLVASQWCSRRLQIRLDAPPQLNIPCLGLALGGAAAFIAAEHWLDINTLSATLFGLASYGLAGLWMEAGNWRRGAPAALLLIGALPFGEHMETFIGYPLRLATARVVGQGLSALGMPNLGVDTILVFESGLSQVDSPCSGVKSLWTGALFLLAATWIERRPINRRWFLIAMIFAGLLLAANLGRVAVLVIVGQAAGWRLLAEMLHVPLGVIGFGAACAAAVMMLHRGEETHSEKEARHAPLRPAWLTPSISAALAVLALLYTPRADPAAASGYHWSLPQEMQAEQWEFTPAERDWLTDHKTLPVAASRWRFRWRGLNGSLLFIASDTWRAHHRPERCFSVYGLEVQASQPHLAAPDFPLRWLSLGKPGENQPLVSAGYWLQSGSRLTDDYAVRIWDDIAPEPETWVLVTVLFSAPVDPTASETQSLFNALRESVQRSLDAKGW